MQNCKIYKKESLGYDDIVFSHVISPTISICILNHCHMFKKSVRYHSFIPHEIIKISIAVDKRINNVECLNKLLEITDPESKTIIKKGINDIENNNNNSNPKRQKC